MRGKQTHYHQNKGKKEEDRDGEEVFCVVGFAYRMRRFPLDKSSYAEKSARVPQMTSAYMPAAVRKG